MTDAQETLDQLMQQHGSRLLRLCTLNLRDASLAQDAVQDTFMKAFRHFDQFRGEAEALTWLTSIAINVCRDMLRSGWLRTMRRSQPVEDLFDLEAEGDIQEEVAVRDAVLRLPGVYREVILMHYDQDDLAEEIDQIRKAE